jgi:hypothetical protein
MLPEIPPVPKEPAPLAGMLSIKTECFNNGKESKGKASEALKFILSGQLDASGIFSTVLFSTSTPKNASDYTLEVKADSVFNEAATAISGFISGFTLFIVPGFSKNRLIMDASLSDSEGHPLWSKQYQDGFTLVTSPILIPAMFLKNTSPKSAPLLTIENMNRHLIHDLRAFLISFNNNKNH